jgi:hypothetical protein
LKIFGAPAFNPQPVIPALREDAPQPIVSRSNTATETPAFANVRAQLNPVYPPPMMATSASVDSSVEIGKSGFGKFSDQKGISFKLQDSRFKLQDTSFKTQASSLFTDGVNKSCERLANFRAFTFKILISDIIQVFQPASQV